jgi:ClpP class serine protease
VIEEGKAKLQEELDDSHANFKDHVAITRPEVRENKEEIARGEYWF